MSNQDLSLLTDEQRKDAERLFELFKAEEAIAVLGDSDDVLEAIEIGRRMTKALIAARSENKRLQSELEVARMPIQGYRALEAQNKRKDEMLRSLEWSGSYWDSISGEVLSVCPECDAPHSDMGHLVDCKLATLLQSEKGGE